MKKKLYNGNCLDILPTLPANKIDTCITDPPYELGFMNKDWDSAGISFQKETWEAVYRVLKPGALLLAFGGTRTWHRIAVAIEDAGFEIRDTICWLYGQGFPKSYNISKGIDKKAGKEREIIGKNPNARPNSDNRGEGVYGGGKGSDHSPNLTAPATLEAELWEGYGTALKPAFEPIIVAMKPIDGTYVNNALAHGVAGMWIDGGRIYRDPDDKSGWSQTGSKESENLAMSGKNYAREPKPDASGRWPSNVILDEISAEMLDQQTGIQKGGFVRNRTDGARPFENDGKDTGYETVAEISEPDGGASRFFYCAKANKKERNAGLDDLPDKQKYAKDGSSKSHEIFTSESANDEAWAKKNPNLPTKNTHATVKPLSLMEYLCKLTRTPTGGIVLDPFMGSGTTGMACVNTDRDFIGIELNEEYYVIARKRIEYAQEILKQD
jgi:site-specific DNA-methyltransferase (adenine-specific)